MSKLSLLSYLCVGWRGVQMTDSRVADELFSFPASLKFSGRICCTPTTHLHRCTPTTLHPRLPPPTAKHAAAEMFYSVSCATVERSACISDVEFEYVWHCNLNDLGLNEISFVMPCISLCVLYLIAICLTHQGEKSVISQLIYGPECFHFAFEG